MSVTPATQSPKATPPARFLDRDQKPLPGRWDLPLDLVVPSPTNPRTYFDPKGLEDLAQSIRSVGVKDDVLVRPVQATAEILALLEDDLKPKIALGTWVYELASGHRRRISSRMAGKTEIPAKVEYLTDAEILELQLVAIEQHENVQDMELARGYARMLGQRADDGETYTHAKIAQRIGKHPSYVYRILQLNNLVQPIQEALLRGLITQSHAVEICRRPPVDQYRIFIRMFGQRHKSPTDVLKDSDAVVTMSVKGLREFIATAFDLDLTRAPFDPKDPNLVREAGSCTDCRKRTGNQPDFTAGPPARAGVARAGVLFTDVSKADPKASPNVCTDGACYERKKEALVQIKLQVVQQQEELKARHQLQLQRVLHSDNATVWKRWRESGASDAQLLALVRSVIGTTSGFATPEWSVCCKSGDEPAIWFDKNKPEGPPSLKGKELVQQARTVLGIGTEAAPPAKKSATAVSSKPVEVLRISNEYSYNSSASSIRTKHKGVLFADQYTEAAASCKDPRLALWVDGKSLGQQTRICLDKKCRHGFVSGARDHEEDGRMRKIREAQKLQTEFRYVLANTVRSKFPGAIGTVEVRLLSRHIVDRLGHDDRLRLCKLYQWEIKETKRSWGGVEKNYEQTILEQVEKMSITELPKLMLACTLLPDLSIPGYSPGAKLAADSRLHRAAEVYRVNPERVLAAIQKSHAKGAGKKKPAKAKAKAAKGGR